MAFAMASLTVFFLSVLFQSVYACPQHDISSNSHSAIHKRSSATQDWTYDKSYDWDYTLCQTGTTQSPIRLSKTPGLSSRHPPSFSENYNSVAGQLMNWGYGAAFEVDEPDVTRRPSLKYDDVTIYLKGWHIHAPADHTVDNFRSRAELHLVHTDANGAEAGVLGFLIDPGLSQSEFFSQIITSSPSMIPRFDSDQKVPTTLNMAFVLNEVDRFQEFWTYLGSLTSPPCTEGIRWWVARKVLFVNTPQLQELLRVSTYSARAEQSVWEHNVNL